jgi:hypothetical protein
MIEAQCHDEEDKGFVEFRRKVKSAEVLSASIERLLRVLHFNGRLCIVIKNGQILKSGYEEGYFRNMGAELVSAR